jgi:hypothetical protein
MLAAARAVLTGIDTYRIRQANEPVKADVSDPGQRQWKEVVARADEANRCEPYSYHVRMRQVVDDGANASVHRVNC